MSTGCGLLPFTWSLMFSVRGTVGAFVGLGSMRRTGIFVDAIVVVGIVAIGGLESLCTEIFEEIGLVQVFPITTQVTVIVSDECLPGSGQVYIVEQVCCPV